MLEFQDRTAAVGEDNLLCRHLPLDVSSPLVLDTEGVTHDSRWEQNVALESWSFIILVSKQGLV